MSDVQTFSGGEAAGSGRVRTDLTAVYPYVKSVPKSRTDLWAALGKGMGDAANVRSLREGIPREGDLSISVVTAALRHALADWPGMQRSVLAGAGMATLSIDGEDSLAGLDSTASGIRAGVELAGTSAYSPCLRLNARFDGGGAMSDAGQEAEAGLRHTTARGRYMALSGDANYEELGTTAKLRIKYRVPVSRIARYSLPFGRITANRQWAATSSERRRPPPDYRRGHAPPHRSPTRR